MKSQNSSPHARRIALSFDDAPTRDSPLMTGTERTSLLIDSLARCGVRGAMFFVSSKGLKTVRDGKLRLRQYRQAGHALANHGHAHLKLSATRLSDYLADLDHASDLLRTVDCVAPFFRHPYLDEGKNRNTHRDIDRALARRGLRRGHVTVATYDFYLQQLLDAAITAQALVDFDSVRNLYVGLILGCVEFYDALALRVINRSPPHVLLLHENDLAALFVAELVGELTKRGWLFVPATEAYDDPIFSKDPETVFRNQGLLAALADASGCKRRALVPVEEEEDHISARFRACVAER
jgi:peptidoglycan-N-acetylglucosamine deacetylase